MTQNYPPFIVKKLILTTILNNENSYTSEAIYEKSNYRGTYNSLRSLLYDYKKRGYLEVINKGRPALYSVTSLGKMHAENEFFAINRRRRKIEEKAVLIANAMLEDSDIVQQKASEIANRIKSDNVTTIIKQEDSNICDIGNESKPKVIENNNESSEQSLPDGKDGMIAKLREEIEFLESKPPEIIYRNVYVSAEDEKQQRNDKSVNRAPLARSYNGKLLDDVFFDGLVHYGLYKKPKGALEFILGKDIFILPVTQGNPSVKLDLLEKITDRKEVLSYKLFISNYFSDGFIISSKNIEELARIPYGSKSKASEPKNSQSPTRRQKGSLKSDISTGKNSKVVIKPPKK
ncbi:hypothetical protein [Methanococcoides alaskense]|uniref:Uncharacterized protein n=1 Tax=Methanococcoides alaskense TaxID=325778 RepID=A0AA90Z8M4_9EURY|nr:hypothetical protein [Methanococcoides alaskense]MDA0525665.1 hypothetical protein [Methanococcoides alaskense]MDR6222891.1 hypothetical protein [Methanococcoides alaskense]